ncbi:hypothetical protein [Lagierella massiliensis]|uniref:hypothetical protein n=1 Tax=Lagierella massiliensis TaxID=1689303 RepID=UPI0006D7E9E0|nr:hypothetical protein [Lagierella massiliensis]
MSSHYNQNYSWEEINGILEKIKTCVNNDKFIIARNQNRQENNDFLDNYNIRYGRQKSILLNLRVDDFCHSLNNINPGYEHEVLYVFVPSVELFNDDDIAENVDIYIKVNIIESLGGNRVIVISFHELNRPIDYLFK